MNLFNTLLILIIIIYLINILTNNNIINLINDYLLLGKNKIENFIGLVYDSKESSTTPDIPLNKLDFSYLTNDTIINYDDDIYSLYNFINTLIKPNINIYELTQINTNTNSNRIIGDKNFNNSILNYINKIFNSGYFIFTNINLVNDIYYYKHQKDIYVELFKFSANVNLNNGLQNKFIGNFIFAIELFIHENKQYHDFYNMSKHYNYISLDDPLNFSFGYTKNQYVTILTVKILGNNNKILPYKFYKEPNCVQSTQITIPHQHYNKKNSNKINKSFDDYFVNREVFDDLFIKPSQINSQKNIDLTVNIKNDVLSTENSLIPSIVNISQSYEENSTDS